MARMIQGYLKGVQGYALIALSGGRKKGVQLWCCVCVQGNKREMPNLGSSAIGLAGEVCVCMGISDIGEISPITQ